MDTRELSYIGTGTLPGDADATFFWDTYEIPSDVQGLDWVLSASALTPCDEAARVVIPVATDAPTWQAPEAVRVQGDSGRLYARGPRSERAKSGRCPFVALLDRSGPPSAFPANREVRG